MNKIDTAFIALFVLVVAIALLLIFYENNALFGGVILVLGALIALFKLKEVRDSKISINIFKALVPYSPFNLVITNTENETIATSNIIKSIKEVTKLNCILQKTNKLDSDKAIIKTNDNKQYLSQTKEILDQEKNLIGYAEIAVDISELMEHQESLIHYHNQIINKTGKNLADLVDNNGDGMIIFALDLEKEEITKCIDFNDKMRQLSELHAEQLRDIKILDLFHSTEKERVESILKILFEQDSILFETLLVNNTEFFPVEILAHTCKIYGEMAVYLSIRDTRNRKKEENQRNKNRLLLIRHKQSQESVKLLNILLFKINASIQEIHKQARAIEDIYIESKDSVSEIQKSTDKITQELQHLMSFYIPNNVKTQINVKNLLETIKSTFFFKEVANNVSIVIIQKDEIGDVYCHEDVLKYVFIAILNYLIKNINANKGTNFFGMIDVTLKEQEDCVQISFEDNGGEIEHLERVFDAFNFLRDRTLGISMPTCKVLVEEKLFGSINASNTANGVKFDISIEK